MSVSKHIQCKKGDIANCVLLPGDPGRARRISDELAECRTIGENREFLVINGKTKNGTEVTVCSTGIGGPSVAIAIEELIRAGGNQFIRIGSAGGRQEFIQIGGLVIVTGAYRGDGVGSQYLPMPFPAIGDLDIITSPQSLQVNSPRYSS